MIHTLPLFWSSILCSSGFCMLLELSLLSLVLGTLVHDYGNGHLTIVISASEQEFADNDRSTEENMEQLCREFNELEYRPIRLRAEFCGKVCFFNKKVESAEKRQELWNAFNRYVNRHLRSTSVLAPYVFTRPSANIMVDSDPRWKELLVLFWLAPMIDIEFLQICARKRRPITDKMDATDFLIMERVTAKLYAFPGPLDTPVKVVFGKVVKDIRELPISDKVKIDILQKFYEKFDDLATVDGMGDPDYNHAYDMLSLLFRSAMDLDNDNYLHHVKSIESAYTFSYANLDKLSSMYRLRLVLVCPSRSKMLRQKLFTDKLLSVGYLTLEGKAHLIEVLTVLSWRQTTYSTRSFFKDSLRDQSYYFEDLEGLSVRPEFVKLTTEFLETIIVGRNGSTMPLVKPLEDTDLVVDQSPVEFPWKFRLSQMKGPPSQMRTRGGNPRLMVYYEWVQFRSNQFLALTWSGYKPMSHYYSSGGYVAGDSAGFVRNFISKDNAFVHWLTTSSLTREQGFFDLWVRDSTPVNTEQEDLQIIEDFVRVPDLHSWDNVMLLLEMALYVRHVNVEAGVKSQFMLQTYDWVARQPTTFILNSPMFAPWSFLSNVCSEMRNPFSTTYMGAVVSLNDLFLSSHGGLIGTLARTFWTNYNRGSVSYDLNARRIREAKSLIYEVRHNVDWDLEIQCHALYVLDQVLKDYLNGTIREPMHMREDFKTLVDKMMQYLSRS